jgi:uridine nucleosidase
MVPLNVTHTAILTPLRHSRLLEGSGPALQAAEALLSARTPLRHSLSTLLGYFAESYRSTFGFINGPPIHDALTIAYISQPRLFKTKRYRVDVELGTGHAVGETIVDMWNYRKPDDSWGPDAQLSSMPM